MKNLCGYLGLFQPPLNGYMSSIYCVATPDKRNLVMVPLVANFFETAYSVAKEPEYQRIFLVLPSLDMLLISDAYLFYYEIAKKLNKKVEIFCNDKPQIPVTDEFYSHVHIYSMDKTFQFTDYLNNDENLEFLNYLNTILLGGESLPEKIVNEIQNRCTAKIFNMYGPTETTIWSTIKEIKDSKDISIGTPIVR